MTFIIYSLISIVFRCLFAIETIRHILGYIIVRIGDGDGLREHLIGVITGCRGGYSIGCVVLIMSRAMLQADSYHDVVPTTVSAT